MSSNSGPGKSKDGRHDPSPKDQQNIAGIPGKEAHGGDVAPPNADDADRRQSPASGPPRGS